MTPSLAPAAKRRRLRIARHAALWLALGIACAAYVAAIVP